MADMVDRLPMSAHLKTTMTTRHHSFVPFSRCAAVMIAFTSAAAGQSTNFNSKTIAANASTLVNTRS